MSEGSTEQTGEPRSQRRHFTVDEANRALPYVDRVLRDVRDAYHEAVRVQQRLQEAGGEGEQRDLQRDYEQTVEKLNRCVDELHEMGVELKDYEVGLVDFPAIHEDREVYLCWKLGEERIRAWHELDGGFAGRHAISTLKEPAGSVEGGG